MAGGGGGRRKGKKGKKGKKARKKSRGGGAAEEVVVAGITMPIDGSPACFGVDQAALEAIFKRREDQAQPSTKAKSDKKSKHDDLSAVTPYVKPRRARCWYCADKVCLRFLDLLTYPRPVRKFKMLLLPSMLLKDLRALLAKEVNINAEDLVLMKKGRLLPFQTGSDASNDGKKYGDANTVTLSQIGLKWNQLVVISQVPLALRTTDTDTNMQSNRDEQNKQFVGDLLFGHNPPEGSDTNGIGQAQRYVLT